MSDLIAYVRRNQMEVVNLEDGRVARGQGKEVKSRGLFSAQPRLLVQPLEMTEGGLSEVEERVFLELGEGAGARHVKVHTGPKLSQQAALGAINARA
jgi:hypothetical protein